MGIGGKSGTSPRGGAALSRSASTHPAPPPSALPRAPRMFSDSPSPIAQSLGHAFARGLPWSPDYHKVWLVRGPDGELPRDFTPIELPQRVFEEGGKAPAEEKAEPLEESIAADALFKLLVEFKAKLEKSELDDQVTRVGRIELELRGIRAVGLTVTGELDLTGFVLPTPIDFTRCMFADGIVLENARLGPLNLSGSEFPFLDAEALRVDGDFGLFGLEKTDYINLERARISGSLGLGGSKLNPGALPASELPGGRALTCNGATIGASVFLSEGFTATGEVNFVGATIGGQLDGEDGHFTNESGRALDCNGATIGADVFLRHGFTATGEVNFVGATIGGQLACVKGTFTNEGGRALTCDAATIGASVFLSEGFTATGEVNFTRATITGDLRCHRGSFAAPPKAPWYAAMDLNAAKIGGGLYLCQVKEMKGQLDLRDATVDYLIDDGKAWPEPGKLNLDGFHYNRFSNDWAADHGAPITKTDFATRKEWLERQPKEDLKTTLKPQPWTQCAKVLRAMGHTRDARLLLHARDQLWLKSGQVGFWTRQFHRWLLGPMAGYGYKTHFAFLWALVFIALGWLIFAAADAKGLIWRAPGQSASVHAEKFHPLTYTADAFLPAISLGETDLWLPRGAAEASHAKSTAPRVVHALDPAFCPGAEDLAAFLGERRVALADFCRATVQPVMSRAAKPLDWALDRGLARLWLWAEILMGWVLLGIVAAGLAGVLQRKLD